MLSVELTASPLRPKPTLPFCPASVKGGAGEEHEFLSFIPTFIVIFLSGLLK